MVVRYADRLPRNVQRHLGPSELGYSCNRRLVGQMAGVTLGPGGTNRMHDPWASIVGTAIHAFLDDAFKWESLRLIREGLAEEVRWHSERRVTPDPGSPLPHPGTADLYDAQSFTVDDHKAQAEGVRDKLRRKGPPQHYFMQLLLYAIGYMLAGFRVDRVCLVSWPRTKSTLDDMYVWEHVITTADIASVVDLIEKTEARESLARMVVSGDLDFWEVPVTPSEDDCLYCPYFRPDAASNPRVKGCPGTAALKRVLRAARRWQAAVLARGHRQEVTGMLPGRVHRALPALPARRVGARLALDDPPVTGRAGPPGGMSDLALVARHRSAAQASMSSASRRAPFREALSRCARQLSRISRPSRARNDVRLRGRAVVILTLPILRSVLVTGHPPVPSLARVNAGLPCRIPGEQRGEP